MTDKMLYALWAANCGFMLYHIHMGNVGAGCFNAFAFGATSTAVIVDFLKWMKND